MQKLFAALLLLAAPLLAQDAKKLSDSTVPTATSVSGDDYFYVLQAGDGKKIGADDLGASLFDIAGAFDGIELEDDTCIHFLGSVGVCLCGEEEPFVDYDCDGGYTVGVDLLITGIGDVVFSDGRSAGQNVAGGKTAADGGFLRLMAFDNQATSPFIYLKDDVGIAMGAGGFTELVVHPADGTLALEGLVSIGASDSEDPTTGACLANSSGAFADADCDGTKDAGEGYLADTYALQMSTTTSGLGVPADSTTYYVGGAQGRPLETTASRYGVRAPYGGTITAATMSSYCATAGSTTSWSWGLAINGGGATTVQAVSSGSNSRVWTNSSLSIAVSANAYIEWVTTTPAWPTNPVGCEFWATVVITR